IKTTPAGSNKGFFFTVTCSIHAPGSMIVTRTDGLAFVDWFKSAFHDPMVLGEYKSLSDLFVRGTGAELDSEAGNYKTTLTYIVAGAMANAGLDVSNVIWRISREQWKGWVCRTGTSCRGTIDILLADKADAKESNKNKPIAVTKFTLTVIYDAKGNATFQTSETQTTARLELKNENEPNKNKYWVLNGV
ncbi:hypothetical protein, partial [Sutterella sp.]|uniref:hypothetical protein n=1 Tax=Sutterella sp. TaxID=1981025 RepID=UPI003FD79551